MSQESTSDKCFSSLFEHSSNAILIIDPADGAIVDANQKARIFYGWPSIAVHSHRFSDVTLETNEVVSHELEQARAGNCDNAHMRHRRADSVIRDVEVFFGQVRDGERQLVSAIVHDVTRQRKIENDLSAALQVLEASPVVGFRWGTEDGWPIDYVTANVSNWGYRPDDLASGHPRYADLIHPEDLERKRLDLETYIAEQRDSFIQEYRMRTADGEYFWVEEKTHIVRDADGVPVMLNGVVTDINYKKLAELHMFEALSAQHALNQQLEDAQGQFLRSEILASVGRLAAGVAHELNNPISFVTSNFGSLESYVTDLFEILEAFIAAALKAPFEYPELVQTRKLLQQKDIKFLRQDTLELISESRGGLNRATKIVNNLREFSHAGEAEWQWADLHAGIESALNMLANDISKHNCTLAKKYGNLPLFWCVPAQINQVFFHLILNAVHAISDHGAITIGTGRDGENICITISDTGTGIDPDILNRIFEPFFTTKPVGEGTGLGLFLAYAIVRKHNGRINVDSVIGQGTTFTVSLPISKR